MSVSVIMILVVIVVVGVLLYLLDSIPMDANIRKIVRVVAILLLVLWILQSVGFIHTGLRF